jgi:predicted DNA-binding antitoxin AbrB/MazE fold protein
MRNTRKARKTNRYSSSLGTEDFAIIKLRYPCFLFFGKQAMNPLVVEAIYENGVLKPSRPLPLQEHEQVRVTVDRPALKTKALDAVKRNYGLIQWTGSPEDLDYLINDVENDPLESP